MFPLDVIYRFYNLYIEKQKINKEKNNESNEIKEESTLEKSDSDDDNSQNEEEETTAVKVEKNEDESNQCKFTVLKLLFVFFHILFCTKIRLIKIMYLDLKFQIFTKYICMWIRLRNVKIVLLYVIFIHKLFFLYCTF